MNFFSVGIDIGGTNISIGFIDNADKVVGKESFPFSDFPSANDFVNFATKFILESGYQICGVGIGAPNGNFYSGSIEDAPNLPWEGVIPLAALLENKLKKPVKLTNDANAAALGEMIYGAAKGMKDFLVVTLGTGLGSGFVANGQLILGHNGFAGELGHTIVYPEGRQCGCGRKGCLETYVSAPGIVKTALELINLDIEQKSILKRKSDFDAKDIYSAAIQGDALAISVFEKTGYILGFQLANAAAITEPEVIFLVGGLANAGEMIFDPTRNSFERNVLNIYQKKIKILPSGLPENDAAILGAAALLKGAFNN